MAPSCWSASRRWRRSSAQAGVALDAATLREALPAYRWPAWIETLLTRKRERFGVDLRLVGHWQVVRQGDYFGIQMETLVAPALEAQLVAAGLL